MQLMHINKFSTHKLQLIGNKLIYLLLYLFSWEGFATVLSMQNTQHFTICLWNHIQKTYIKLAETYFVIHMKWVTLLCTESLAAYSCPISKPFEVLCYHQTPHMQPWNPVKFIQFGFMEAFYSNRLCKFLFVQALTNVINLYMPGMVFTF